MTYLDQFYGIERPALYYVGPYMLGGSAEQRLVKAVAQDFEGTLDKALRLPVFGGWDVRRTRHSLIVPPPSWRKDADPAEAFFEAHPEVLPIYRQRPQYDRRYHTPWVYVLHPKTDFRLQFELPHRAIQDGRSVGKAWARTLMENLLALEPYDATCPTPA